MNITEISNLQSAHLLFEKHIIPKLVEDDAVYVFIGTESGLLLDYIEKKFSIDRRGRRFLFIELTDIVSHFGGLSLPKWIKLIDDKNKIEFLLRSEYLDAVVVNKIITVPSIGCVDEINDYVKLEKDVSKLVKFYFNNRHESLNEINYIRPIAYNMIYNINSIQDKENALAGSHAVIIGNGHSLDDSIDWILENKEKLIIFAVARVASRLALAGIKVHFFVTIDPTIESFNNSKFVLETTYSSVLINLNHANENLVSQWQGERLYLRSLYPWQEIDNEDSFLLYMGNTVAHFALASAIILGAKSIYLAGVDMCFKDTQTHASGSAENELGSDYIFQKAKVETYQGALADTSIDFEIGRDYLQKQVDYCYKMGKLISFYNLSPFAAKIDGIALCQDKSIVAENDTMQSNYHTLLTSLTITKEIGRKHIEHVVKEVQTNRKHFLILKKIADEALNLSKKITEPSVTINHKIDKLKTKLFSLLTDSQVAFINKIGYREFENFESLICSLKNKDVQKLNADELKKVNIARYTAFYFGLSAAIILMNETLERIASKRNKDS
jgi:hypothetical protein